jgi:hypothetical protein
MREVFAHSLVQDVGFASTEKPRADDPEKLYANLRGIRCFLFLHFPFKDLTQNQECYWPNSDPKSQPLCMSLLQSRP